MARHYYVLPIDTASSVVYPITPGFITDWVGTDAIGRNCYIVLSAQSGNVPVFGVDVQLSDVVGLSEPALHAKLPIEVPVGMTPTQVDGLTDAIGFNRIDLAAIASMSVGGI